MGVRGLGFRALGFRVWHFRAIQETFGEVSGAGVLIHLDILRCRTFERRHSAATEVMCIGSLPICIISHQSAILRNGKHSVNHLKTHHSLDIRFCHTKLNLWTPDFGKYEKVWCAYSAGANVDSNRLLYDPEKTPKTPQKPTGPPSPKPYSP